jgi:hypothetical protein
MSKPVISEEQLKKYVPSTEVWLFNNQETDAKWTNLSIFICTVAVILITLPWFFLGHCYREAAWDLNGYWAIAVMAPATIVAIIHTLRYGKYLLTGHILKYSVDEMPTSEARPAVIFMWLFIAVLSLAVSIASIIVFYLLYVVVSNLIVLIILSSVIIFFAVAYYLRKKRQREIVTLEILKRSNND